MRRDFSTRNAAPVVQASVEQRDLDAAATSVLLSAQSEAEEAVEVAAVTTGIPVSTAPATVTTSTRTITSGAPRLTSVREASFEVASAEKSAMDAVAAYTAAQAAKAVAASGGMQ